MTIRFFVPGIPRPGGSKKAFPFKRKDGRMGVRVTDASTHGKDWRTNVKAAGFEAYHDDLLTGPLGLSATFVMPRPKGHYGTGRNAEVLKASAPAFPTTKPDVLKLARALEDALTGIVWRDDAQIVSESIAKVYGNRPGAHVCIVETSGEPADERDLQFDTGDRAAGLRAFLGGVAEAPPQAREVQVRCAVDPTSP